MSTVADSFFVFKIVLLLTFLFCFYFTTLIKNILQSSFSLINVLNSKMLLIMSTLLSVLQIVMFDSTWFLEDMFEIIWKTFIYLLVDTLQLNQLMVLSKSN